MQILHEVSFQNQRFWIKAWGKYAYFTGKYKNYNFHVCSVSLTLPVFLAQVCATSYLTGLVLLPQHFKQTMTIHLTMAAKKSTYQKVSFDKIFAWSKRQSLDCLLDIVAIPATCQVKQTTAIHHLEPLDCLSCAVPFAINTEQMIISSSVTQEQNGTPASPVSCKYIRLGPCCTPSLSQRKRKVKGKRRRRRKLATGDKCTTACRRHRVGMKTPHLATCVIASPLQ